MMSPDVYVRAIRQSVTTILNQIQYPEVSYDAAEQRVSL
jgi:hypothetical protein